MSTGRLGEHGAVTLFCLSVLRWSNNQLLFPVNWRRWLLRFLYFPQHCSLSHKGDYSWWFSRTYWLNGDAGHVSLLSVLGWLEISSSSVCMLHVGVYDDEPQSFELMNEFIKNNKLERTSLQHREIYLSDFKS
jgi:hypothetical protein